MSPIEQQIAPKDWAMVLVLGLVWGATFMFIEIALRGITPFWLAAARIGFAMVLTVAVWRLLGGRLWLTEARDPVGFALSSLLSTAVPFLLLSWGIQHVSSGFAGVTMASVALMVLPLAHVMVPGEQMTLRRALGVGIGFAGVVILFQGQSMGSESTAEMMGRMACFGAAFCYALSSVLIRRLPPVDSYGLAAVPLIIGTAVTVPLAWIIEGAPPLPGGQTLLMLAVLGLIPTAGANLLRVLVIRSAGPVFMSLVNYQVPLWSVLFGILLLAEPFRLSLVFGMALILGGVFLSQWGALRRLFGAGRAG